MFVPSATRKRRNLKECFTLRAPLTAVKSVAETTLKTSTSKRRMKSANFAKFIKI